MYKSRLQELCVRQMWPLPDYTVSRHGPDHNPRFRASVTVNGVSFDAPDLSKSSKEAQDKVAQAAVDHFAVSLPPESSPQPPENSVSYKARLNEYAQKKCIDKPKYEAVREGLDHIPCFKANVSFDNKSFSSEQFFRTLKEAENNAAKVALAALSLAENTQAANCSVGSLSLDGVAIVRNGALNAAHRSLSPDENRKEEPNFYKNFLQELAQKEGILLPKYSTKSHGESHMPCFSSIVEIGGETYMGDLAKTKKQAEMSAAKAAWVELKKRSSVNSVRSGVPLSYPLKEHVEPASQGSQSKAIKELWVPKPPLVLQSHVRIDKHNEKGSSGNFVRPARPLSCSSEDHLEPASKGPQSKAVNNFLLPKYVSVPPAHVKIDKHNGKSADNNQEKGIASKSGSSTVPMDNSLQIYNGALSLKDTVTNGNRHITLMATSQGKLDTEVAKKKACTVENPLSHEDDGAAKNGSSTFPVATMPQVQLGADSAFETTANDVGHAEKMHNSHSKLGAVVATEKECTTSQEKISTLLHQSECSDLNPSNETSLLCNRVKVFPHKPDMVLPEGTEFLPFSDDMWAAVSLDFSNQEDKSEEGGNTIENKSSTGDTSSTLHYDQRTNSSKEIMQNDDDSINDSVTLQLQKLGIEVIEDDLFEDRTSSSFGDSAPTGSVTAEVHSTSLIGGVGNSLLCNRVRVYPNVPGLVLPEGASLLPFSDDKWVAISLGFSNHEGGISV